MKEEYWQNLVASTVRVKKPEDVFVIAKACHVAEQAGTPTGVWHEAARFYGNKCHCVPCSTQSGGLRQ